ncbi:MAG: exodeoxyribonuclease III [Pseudomonadota bacterium]
MALKICTWNINSVRLRAELVERLLGEQAPDVLCLQETKSPVEKIPYERFTDAGYAHAVARGQKGYNGVMILSRHPLEDAGSHNFCAKGDARHVAGTLPSGVTIHNYYVPAGGDEPNPEVNEKFRHKLDFLEEMRAWYVAAPPQKSVMVGDLNIAPLEDDVWSHKALLKVVSHNPIEVEGLNTAQTAGKWVDAVRSDIPEGKLYSWWSYRAKDWRASNKGRRLDHIWTTPDLPIVAGSAHVLDDARDWEKPSDHAPVFITLDVEP